MVMTTNQKLSSVNSALEWSCILTICINIEITLLTSQNHLTPCSLLSLQTCLFVSICVPVPVQVIPHRESECSFWKANLIMPLLSKLSQPFQNIFFFHCPQDGNQNLESFSLILWFHYFLLFSPIHVLPLYTYRLAFSLVLWLPLPFLFCVFYSWILEHLFHLFHATLLASTIAIALPSFRSRFLKAASLIKSHPWIALPLPMLLIIVKLCPVTWFFSLDCNFPKDTVCRLVTSGLLVPHRLYAVGTQKCLLNDNGK